MSQSNLTEQEKFIEQIVGTNFQLTDKKICGLKGLLIGPTRHLIAYEIQINPLYLFYNN